MDIKFSEDNLKKLEAIKEHYPVSSAALMPALWLVQKQFGWISEDTMKYISKLLDIPSEQIYGVVKFYTMLNSVPKGKFHLEVCTNISCMLRGSYDILKYISEKLNISSGETTPDGMFTLNEVECLGSCGTAPAMQVNDHYEENLNKEKIDKIIESLSMKTDKNP
ncbi:MAG: NADH-quinone oxidoreductase subunit NuoE [Ignavibacteria bacterium]|jgi:NADH-quinone oxidoreductase E subunit